MAARHVISPHHQHKSLPNKSATSIILGFGGSSPKKTRDVLIQTHFLTIDKPWSQVPFISAGIPSSGTFPGDLALGHTFISSLGSLFQIQGAIQLLNVPQQPNLSLMSSTSEESFLSFPTSEYKTKD